MSYGWLTESSLIPKPAKPIAGVPESSLSTLKSLMLEKEHESKKRKLISGTNKSKPTKKFRSRMEREFMDKQNEGVEKRQSKDEVERADEDEAARKTFAASRKRLEEKAKLYQSIQNTGDTPSVLQDKRGALELCLDIEKKRRQNIVTNPTGSVSAKAPAPSSSGSGS